MRLLGPQSQDAAASPAIVFLSSGYRPIGSRTRLSGLSRSDFVPWPICMDPPCVARENIEAGLYGLAPMYQASNWNSCSGPSWNPRASELISGHASKGNLGHQFSDALGRPFLHLYFFSRRPRWEIDRGAYITLLLVLALGLTGGRSFVLADDEHGEFTWLGTQAPSVGPRSCDRHGERPRRCGRFYWRAQSPA